MEIPIPDMADNWGGNTGFGNIDLRGLNTFGQPRNRNTDIGGHRLRSGA